MNGRSHIEVAAERMRRTQLLFVDREWWRSQVYAAMEAGRRAALARKQLDVDERALADLKERD